jgi:protein-S-isoprenylcysteine O-methyltransferase Ste14
MRVYDIVIAVCWLVFFATWAVLALPGSRTGRRAPSAGQRLVRLAVLSLAALAVIFADRLPVDLARSTARFAEDIGAAAVGDALCVAGLAFAVWARVALGRSWGMPMTLHEKPELVTRGPYAYVRHPIYTGVSTMAIGTTLVYPLAGIWAVALTAYFVFSARREERDMEQRFPDTYPAYRQRSKMLVPFVF